MGLRVTPLRTRLGPERIELSPFTFGTMRLTHLSTGADLATLFHLLDESGVDTFHSSDEYDTFPVFSEAVRTQRAVTPSWQPRHIVKVAEPSFGEDHFDQDRFRRRVDSYLGHLGAERLDVVQWMIRSDTADTAKRLNILQAEASCIGECLDRLRADGKIGAVVVFPYAHEDVDACLVHRWCDGCAVYFNLEERQWVAAIRSAAQRGKGVVAIRPFGNGSAVWRMATALESGSPLAVPLASQGWDNPGAACVGLALLHPAIVTTAGTATSEAHLRAIRSVLDTKPNLGLFDRLVASPDPGPSTGATLNR